MSKRNLSLFLILLGLIIFPLPSRGARQAAQTQASAYCPPLDPPSGNVVNVANVTQLQNAVNTSPSGTTILVADGTYDLHGIALWFNNPNVTLRSASGDREAVVISGNYETTEIITIAASNVTIADLTLQRADTHPIHVVSTASADTTGTLIYNVHIVDPTEQAIKINPDENRTHFPDDGVVACSHIELTDAGRPHVRGCYTGGVDAHQAWGWTIRDNLIKGFWCEYGLSEHAIHLWTGSRDTLTQRNVLVDNARGVGYGLLEYRDDARTYPDNPCPGASYVGHYDGIIRNNFIFAQRGELFASEYGFDCGVCLAQACGTQVLHNTVASTQAPFSSIEWRFDDTDAEITNNLVSHNLRDRGGTASLQGNLDYAPLSLFVDGAGGDLHLLASASAAIDQGVTLAAGLCDDDVDGDARPSGSGRDIGADEYVVPAPAAVRDLFVTHAPSGSSVLTPTLRWTAPINALTYTLRYADTPISESDWESAADIPVPFMASAPGTTESLAAPVPYTGGALYFALKSQSAGGNWSALSNNAFWPYTSVWIPLVLKP
jgi:hypothetical protein